MEIFNYSIIFHIILLILILVAIKEKIKIKFISKIIYLLMAICLYLLGGMNFLIVDIYGNKFGMLPTISMFLSYAVLLYLIIHPNK